MNSNVPRFVMIIDELNNETSFAFEEPTCRHLSASDFCLQYKNQMKLNFCLRNRLDGTTFDKSEIKF